MSKNRQAEIFRVEVKSRLIASRLSITALACQIGYTRNAVSLAINRGVFPGVIRAIKNHLGIE